MASSLDRIDGFDVLTRLDRRSVQVAYIVFLRREEGLATTTADVAGHFKDCSDHFAASVLHGAADAGALRAKGEEWRVTPEGVAAMRIHYVGWREHFDDAAEERGMS